MQRRFAGPIEADRFQQPFAGILLVLVDQRAVPSELIGRPPGQRDQAHVDAEAERRRHVPLEPHELVDRQQGDDGQGKSEQRRPLSPAFDGNPADQDRADDEQSEDTVQPQLKIAVVEDLQQEEHQAADQRDDQRRTDGDDQIIDERFF